MAWWLTVPFLWTICTVTATFETRDDGALSKRLGNSDDQQLAAPKQQVQPMNRREQVSAVYKKASLKCPPPAGIALVPPPVVEVVPFNISDCNSYWQDWLVELATSCQSILYDSVHGCQCQTASLLLQTGVITCATLAQVNSSPPACPLDCPICQLCLTLAGCPDIYHTLL